MFEISESAARSCTKTFRIARPSYLIGGLLALAVAGRASTFTNFQTIWPFALSNGVVAPNAAVTEGSDGMLYGTAYGYTVPTNSGVFRMGKDGSHFQVLRQFAQPEGYQPLAPVIEATNGVLYGTTSADTTNSGGTIFKINKDGSGFAVLHYFTFATNDGGNPFSALLQASDGELYGTAQFGGTALAGDGVIFRIDLSGSNFVVLHSFTGDDGNNPTAALIEGTNGALYGTTLDGGTNLANQDGVIFRIDKSGSNYAVVHYFAVGTNDGFEPYAKLFKGPNGKLYGTTERGGLYNIGNNGGVAFSMDYNGSNYTVLHSFAGTGDGNTPMSDIVQGPDGLLYSTAYDGGNANAGTVFAMNADGSGYTNVASFNSTNGFNPNPLIAGSDGALYGTSQFRGPGGYGTVFKLSGIMPDVLAAPVNLGNGWLVSGHGAANLSYTLLYTTNISTPSSNWTVLGTVSADGSGNWQYDDLTNTPQRFYQTSYP
jgi:uncharacterized repeat protein (TIGR03803 family)